MKITDVMTPSVIARQSYGMTRERMNKITERYVAKVREIINTDSRTGDIMFMKKVEAAYTSPQSLTCYIYDGFNFDTIGEMLYTVSYMTEIFNDWISSEHGKSSDIKKIAMSIHKQSLIEMKMAGKEVSVD